MDKIDYKKILKELYSLKKDKVSIVDISAFNYLMIDGKGNPNTSAEYKAAIEALYSVSYSAKFKIKKGNEPVDYSVMPLEGLWWLDGEDTVDFDNKDNWKWTAMIMQPPFVTKDIIIESIEDVKKKKGLDNLDKVQLCKFKEGLAVQIMHIGPYALEKPTITKMYEFMKDSGLEFAGKHHEIYISDPHKCAPEKLKTILRQPVKKI
jgi:hypothetical protein